MFSQRKTVELIKKKVQIWVEIGPKWVNNDWFEFRLTGTNPERLVRIRTIAPNDWSEFRTIGPNSERLVQTIGPNSERLVRIPNDWSEFRTSLMSVSSKNQKKL